MSTAHSTETHISYKCLQNTSVNTVWKNMFPSKVYAQNVIMTLYSLSGFKDIYQHRVLAQFNFRSC